MPDFASAIGQIESGGDYGILGKPTSSGDRAYGKYQVMGSNIGPWTKEVLGAPLSPQEFLGNPQAQDAVFSAKFGQYLDKYGNPNDAASMWFSGKPLAQGADKSDGNVTGAQYVARFNQALGSQAPALGAPQQQPQTALPAAPQMAQEPQQQTAQPVQQQQAPQQQYQLPEQQPLAAPQLYQSRFNLAQALQKIPLPKGFRGFQLG